MARRSRRVVAVSLAALVALVAVATGWDALRGRTSGPRGPAPAVLAGRPAPAPLDRAFPGARVTGAVGVGDQLGEVAPAGLLPDGTVFGVVRRAPGRGSPVTAVTVDPRTGRQVVVARGDGDAEPRFLAADEGAVYGVTERPVPAHVGHGCDLAGAPCAGTRAPPPRYWRHDLATGRTVALAPGPPQAGGRPDLPPPGETRLAPTLAMSVEAGDPRGSRAVVRDTRSGRTRVVLDGGGPVAVANAYGIAWDDAAGSRARVARWGGAARPLDVPATGSESRLTPVAAAGPAFLLADRTRPLGDLALYDPVRDVLTHLGRAHARRPLTLVWAAGRYALWDGGNGDYRFLDLGPQPAPPGLTLDDLRVTG
jgi:hypothetical protein